MPHSKCYVSVNKDPKDTILLHPFNKQVDLLLPLDAYDLIKDELLARICPKDKPPLQYYKLRIPLAAILENDFFNKYIKIGNVVMLSEGHIGTDNVYCLSDGKLRLSLTKEWYEKAGLVGKLAKFGGGKKRQRWNVEFDLRSEMMMHGTKALDRIIWSFTEVLTGRITFLFCDLNQHKPQETPSQASATASAADCPILQILKSQPRQLSPQIHISDPLVVPSMKTPDSLIPHGGTEYSREAWREWALDQLEWLALVALDADRIKANDTVDPYLSTYKVSDPRNKPMKVVRMRWRGMIPANYISGIWAAVSDLLEGKPLLEESAWAALMTMGFENSPISWDKNEHSFLTSGENCYTVLGTFMPSPQPEDEKSMEIDSHQRKEGLESKVLVYEVVCSQDEHS